MAKKSPMANLWHDPPGPQWTANFPQPTVLTQETERVLQLFAKRPKLAQMYSNCLMFTAGRATLLEDGTTFIGQVPINHHRDMAIGVIPYLPFAAKDENLARMIAGLIRRQVRCMLLDSYSHSFKREPNPEVRREGEIAFENPWIWRRKYELDAVCYPIWLAAKYWKATGRINVFDFWFHAIIRRLVEQWKLEQRHTERSVYRYQCPNKIESLPNDGLGMPVTYTGMSWSGFRPSDDTCKYGYYIPSNMFASVTLSHIAEIATSIYSDESLADYAANLKTEIDDGIALYATVEHPRHGKIYCYETDGFGHYELADEGYIPNLLSMPYFGFCDKNDPVYCNTRNFILSRDNPYYAEGSLGKGLGGMHFGKIGWLWPMGLVMQALTTSDHDEILTVVDYLEATDDNTEYMLECVDPNDSSNRIPHNSPTRGFGTANSLFAQLIYQLSREKWFIESVT